MYITNPEIKKQVWLNFSTMRLLAMPVVFALLMIVCKTSSHFGIFFSIYIGCAYIWANFEASRGFQEEVNQKTWDFLRMSAISPWTLTVGKLFGSILYPWYFGIAALVIALCDSGATMFKDVNKPLTFICLVLAPLIGNAATQLVSLLLISEKNHLKKDKNKAFFSFTFGVGISIAALMLVAPIILASRATRLPLAVNDVVRQLDQFSHWYFMEFSISMRSFVTLAFMAFWIIFANYRIVQKELLYKLTPIAWTLFILTSLFYVAGYGVDKAWKMGVILVISYAHLIGLTYATLFIDSTNMPIYRRLVLAWRRRDKKAIFENTPRWVISMLALGLVAALYAVLACMTGDKTQSVLPATGDIGPVLPGAVEKTFYGTATYAFLPMASFLLFTLRDGIVLHFIGLTKRVRHTAFALFFYYLLAYYLLPMAHQMMVSPAAWAFHQSLYSPVPEKGATALSLLLLPCIEVLALGTVLIVYLKKKASPTPEEGVTA